MLLFCQWFDSKLNCSVLRNVNPGNTLGFFNSSCQIQLYEDVPTCTLELILWSLLETFEMIWLSPDLEDCFWKRHTGECISQEVVSDFRLIQHLLFSAAKYSATESTVKLSSNNGKKKKEKHVIVSGDAWRCEEADKTLFPMWAAQMADKVQILSNAVVYFLFLFCM